MCLGLGTQMCFRSKAEAVKYALEATLKFENGQITHHYDKAQEMFDFITKNVTLPEVSEPLEGFAPLIDALVKKLESKEK